ncbi:MAG: glycosyltransferase family 4 protein [Candidatus Helarchaeota archaeon]|nr:glycosyltransferase family 4 protein [Candidatus Helarchaeota archaeon]
MRIGLISSGTPTDRIPPIYGGGIQKYLWSLASALIILGHEVHIFASQQPQQLKEELLEGIHVHRIARTLKTKSLATFLFGAKTVFRLLQIQKATGPFQIIHAQSRVSGLIVRLFFRKTPFIFTAHNWDVALTRPNEIISRLPHTALTLIEKAVLSYSDAIISLTPFFQKVLTTRYKLPGTKIQVIPNMVRISQQTDRHYTQSPVMTKLLAKPFLLFVGRLEKEKGVDFLLEFAKQKSSQGNPQKLIIIGTGSQKNTLRMMTTELGLQNSVHILGTVHEDHLNALISSASALILPSDFEIMPTVILEAWTAKCPVLVHTYRGVQALIRDRETGLLFQTKNPVQLSHLVEELLTNEDLRHKIVQNSLTRVKTVYAASIVGRQIISLYFSVLKGCPP